MLKCPFCGDENIDGADVCEQCQQPLEFMSRPKANSALEQSILKDRVYALAPRQPVMVHPSTSVSQVLDMLVGHSIGCLLVVDGGDLVGIFSERDALTKLNTEADVLGDRPISQFMTAQPETAIEADARIAFALHKMDIGGYRHMPVMTDGRITGVISIRDILDYLTANLLATAE